MFDTTIGKKLYDNFQNGSPFPHVVIDNFISDKSILDSICNEFEFALDWGYDPVAGDNMAKKFFIPWKNTDVSSLPTNTKKFLQSMNMPSVILFLKDLTGITNLFGDPYFAGGGMHRIASGGKLSVHEDFVKHPINQKWYRRLNLLIYLNKDWENSWGGNLQLFDHRTKSVVKEIEPIFNRAVIFDTTKNSLHGHPHPLKTPPNVYRNSLALYYFTAEPSENNINDTMSATWHQLNQDGSLV